MSDRAVFEAAFPYGGDIFALPVADLDSAADWYARHFAMVEVERRLEPHPTVIMERDGGRFRFSVNGGELASGLPRWKELQVFFIAAPDVRDRPRHRTRGRRPAKAPATKPPGSVRAVPLRSRSRSRSRHRFVTVRVRNARGSTTTHSSTSAQRSQAYCTKSAPEVAARMMRRSELAGVSARP